MPTRLVRGQPQPIPQNETEEQHLVRVAREKKLIAEARVELDACLGIEDGQLEVWLDQLDQDPDAPLPMPQAGAAPASDF